MVGTGKPSDGGGEQHGAEEENDEFEDAPEGDDESFASSMGSQNVTPRSGEGATNSSSTEQPPSDMQAEEK